MKTHDFIKMGLFFCDKFIGKDVDMLFEPMLIIRTYKLTEICLGSCPKVHDF